MRLQINGPIVVKRDGKKPASEVLKEMMLEKSKEIKLTVPFQASGTFSKNPLQPDGVTLVVVEPVDFGGKLEEKKPEVEELDNEEDLANKSELYDLVKGEQEKLLKSKGISKIPKFEKGRVKKLLELKIKKSEI
jgi:hypothetical protein